MSNTYLPEEVKREVVAVAYAEADAANYLSSNRALNKRFMAKLEKLDGVGKVLMQYIPKEGIPKYIKDTIMNSYSKVRLRENSPSKVAVIKWCRSCLEVPDLYETARGKGVMLLRNPDGSRFVVVALAGTVIKWETSLRNALLYAAGKPFSSKSGVHVDIVLSLFARLAPVPPEERAQLEQALSRISAYCHIWGEG